MLALAEHEADRCRKCGGDLHETTDPEHDASNPYGRAHYVPGPPVVCHQCLALSTSEKAFAKDARAAALIHVAPLRPRKPRRRPSRRRKG